MTADQVIEQHRKARRAQKEWNGGLGEACRTLVVAGVGGSCGGCFRCDINWSSDISALNKAIAFSFNPEKSSAAPDTVMVSYQGLTYSALLVLAVHQVGHVDATLYVRHGLTARSGPVMTWR